MIAKKTKFCTLLAVGILGGLIITSSVVTNNVKEIVLDKQVEIIGLSNINSNIKYIQKYAAENNQKQLSLIEARNEELAKHIFNDLKRGNISISRNNTPILTSSFVLTEPGNMESINPETLENELNIKQDHVDTGEYQYIGNFKLTSYCGCSRCNGRWAGGAGKFGLPLTLGRTVAVDRRVIPLGTWLEIYIEGQGWQRFRAEDTGSGVRGNHIDVYIGENHSQCINPMYNTNGQYIAQVRIVK